MRQIGASGGILRFWNHREETTGIHATSNGHANRTTQHFGSAQSIHVHSQQTGAFLFNSILIVLVFIIAHRQILITVFRLMLQLVFTEWKGWNPQQIRQTTMTKGMEKESHTSMSQVSIPKSIIRRQYLRIGIQISHPLNVCHQPRPMGSIKRKGRKDLWRFASLFPIHKARIGIVLDKSGTVIIGPRNESFHRHPRLFGSIGKFNRVGSQKDNGARGMQIIEFVSPMHGFVLQDNIILDGLLGEIAAIHLHRFSTAVVAHIFVDHVGFGDIIAGARPTVSMKSMVGRRSWRGGHFLHAKTMSHGSVGKGFLFNLDNGFVGFPLFCNWIVQVTHHELGWDGRNVVLGPNIFFCHQFGSGLLNELLKRQFLCCHFGTCAVDNVG
mmetsp:Transcript_10530/g.21662  ORF Transcript_10530/g.21662 Transcript_10530/m.21662 type:complete len:383 (-) Transcript_10530:241-1389(-)